MDEVRSFDVTVPCPEFEHWVNLFHTMGLLTTENGLGVLPLKHYSFYRTNNKVTMWGVPPLPDRLVDEATSVQILKKAMLGYPCKKKTEMCK